MTYYGFGQIPTFFAPQGVGALAMQGNSALVGLPDMPTAATTDWVMAGLFPTKSSPPLMNTMSIPASAAYRGDPWGNEPLSNGPQQWASTQMENNILTKKIATTSTTDNNAAPKASNKALISGAKPTKIPQWAWEATSDTWDSAARIAIAHILLKECDPNNIDKVVNHPKDPGGVTKYGIAQNHNKGVDVAKLSINEAANIYYNQYWKPNQDLLGGKDIGVQVAISDAIVHSGRRGTKKILSLVDNDALTPASIGEARKSVLRKKAHADSFPGWFTRVDEVTAFAESIN